MCVVVVSIDLFRSYGIDSAEIRNTDNIEGFLLQQLRFSLCNQSCWQVDTSFAESPAKAAFSCLVTSFFWDFIETRNEAKCWKIVDDHCDQVHLPPLQLQLWCSMLFAWGVWSINSLYWRCSETNRSRHYDTWTNNHNHSHHNHHNHHSDNHNHNHYNHHNNHNHHNDNHNHNHHNDNHNDDHNYNHHNHNDDHNDNHNDNHNYNHHNHNDDHNDNHHNHNDNHHNHNYNHHNHNDNHNDNHHNHNWRRSPSAAVSSFHVESPGGGTGRHKKLWRVPLWCCTASVYLFWCAWWC